jgi:hypothetical protein
MGETRCRPWHYAWAWTYDTSRQPTLKIGTGYGPTPTVVGFGGFPLKAQSPKHHSVTRFFRRAGCDRAPGKHLTRKAAANRETFAS